MEIRVHKAARLLRNEPVEPATLHIADELPDELPSLAEAEETFIADAERIEQALRTLPQGTWYQLLLLMLQRAPILYRGPATPARREDF